MGDEQEVAESTPSELCGQKLYKSKGELIVYEDGTTDKTKMFAFLEVPLDDYTDLTFTEPELRKIRMHFMNMQTGIQAMAPIQCGGPVKCPFVQRCPFFDITKTVANQNIKKFPLLRQCVSRDSMVHLSDGKRKKISDIKAGEEVLSLNRDTCEIRFNKVKDIVCNGLKNVYLVKTRGGHAIKATEDHPFFVIKEKVHRRHKGRLAEYGYSKDIADLKHEWISVEDGLSKGHKIAVIDKLGNFTDKDMLPDGMAEFLGYYLGDGSYSGYQATFTNTTFKYVKEFLGKCHQLGTKAVLRRNKKRPNRKHSWTVAISNGDRTLDFCREYLQKVGLAHITGIEKRIPKDIFDTSRKQTIGITRRYPRIIDEVWNSFANQSRGRET